MQGMHCDSCRLLIEETLASQPGVSAVSVDLEAARARVTHDDTVLTVADICDQVADLGYRAAPVEGGA